MTIPEMRKMLKIILDNYKDYRRKFQPQWDYELIEHERTAYSIEISSKNPNIFLMSQTYHTRPEHNDDEKLSGKCDAWKRLLVDLGTAGIAKIYQDAENLT